MRGGEAWSNRAMDSDARGATRRRVTLVAVAAAAALVLVGVLPRLWSNDDLGPAGLPAAPDGARELNGLDVTPFVVPTYPWGSPTAEEALIEGRLGFTDSGCPVSLPDRPSAGSESVPLLFPEAIGVRWANGVRGVLGPDGRLFGIEGQPVAYTGGYSSSGDDAEITPADVCGELPASVGVFRVQEDPGRAAPDAPPPGVEGSDPLARWVDVPTFARVPEEGGDAAAVAGVVEFPTRSCPAVRTVDGQLIGLVLPTAQGMVGTEGGGLVRYRDPGTGVERPWFAEGDEVLLGGGGGGGGGGGAQPEWDALCQDLVVDDVFRVDDQPPDLP